MENKIPVERRLIGDYLIKFYEPISGTIDDLIRRSFPTKIPKVKTINENICGNKDDYSLR